MARRAALATGLVLAALAAAPSTARADTHGWTGQLGPVKVLVWRLGYAEGENEGGWSREEALDFAAWAARVGKALPAGVGVDVSETVEGDEKATATLLRCRTDDRRCEHPLSRRALGASALGGQVSLDDQFAARILAAVGKAIGRPLRLPAAAVTPRLYTIQLLATRSDQEAKDFSRRIDEVFTHDGTYVFDANCGPCSAPPEARIEDGTDGGAAIHRVIVGNYESPRLARDDLARLAGLGFKDAFVRPLR